MNDSFAEEGPQEQVLTCRSRRGIPGQWQGPQWWTSHFTDEETGTE